ncbi:putative RNA-binding Zn ribbon-like protein [Paractinoplanes brasiliensis]|uniref:Putative RNA-binding Zn ribbon-like protein n=2 Tax=Paractinoplanes brasiliensis TaxID=52695 RepID=A0A4R6JKG1_9ACTN|nr:putative RNA-binding Zn ribbon-like protein [Actinoplanes brasiliensis]GID32474.1 hypothetical protein Abr02nite_74570 [Actinoplanes brasiliensis]
MRLVGGNLALDFVNTRSGPDDDVLTDYPSLISWGLYAGALTEAEAAQLSPRAQAAFTRALHTRDYLDEVFRSVATGAEPAPSALTRLRDDEAEALAHAQLERGDTFTWSWRDDHSPDRPLRPVVHAAIELLTLRDLARVKACGGCLFLFYDETKNRSRRWCSMQDCGTDAKMRRYIATRRIRSSPDPRRAE